MIEFIDVGKQYDGHWAIRNLTAHIGRGEIFCMLGPNGAGKTTTIRMMTGLVRPTGGSIRIGGHDVLSASLEAKAITGYVPDKSYLYERLSGREFMAFICSLYGINKEAGTPRITRCLELTGIADVQNDLIKNYSHGMRQRLLFASALVHEPRVLIIDEPFVGLDPYGVRAITALMRELSEGGTTLFLATHSLHIAQELCHRAAIVHKGQLVCILDRGQFEGTLEQRFMEHTS